MVELDQTDTDILQLLMDDARRSYTDIGEQVGLSAPSVSNRITQLKDLGVIDGFTVNIDRSMLATGDDILIEIEAQPGSEEAIVETLSTVDAVECILQAVDPRISAHAYMNDREIKQLFSETLDEQHIQSYEIRKIANSVWKPQIDRSDLAIECIECGKPIEGDGITLETEEQQYYLCCTSCESLFREQYDELKSGV
jgi:Lrp/AsnC family transcriptional regulator, leucine-responsive regulatory protein